MPSFKFWGLKWTIVLPSSPTQLSFAQPWGEVSSFENVLIFAGNNWSGYITESNGVSEWTGIGSFVGEVMILVEYSFVGIRKWRRPSQDKGFMMLSWMGVWDLYKDLELPIFTDVFNQSLRNTGYKLSLSVHYWALCRNATRIYRNKTVIAMVGVLCYIFTARWKCNNLLQYSLCAVLVTAYWSNTEFFWVQLKMGNKNTGNEKIRLQFPLPKNTQCGN